MNQMERLAQLFGVDIDEVFSIIYDGKNVFSKIKEDSVEPAFLEEELNEILSGDYEIEKYRHELTRWDLRGIID